MKLVQNHRPSALGSSARKQSSSILAVAATSLALLLPVPGMAAPAQGWTDNVRAEAIQGCADALKDAVVKQARQDTGMKASDPLPADMSRAVDQQFMPEFKKTCTCTIDRVAEKHSYQEVQSNPDLLKREAQRVGTPQGCPLNI